MSLDLSACRDTLIIDTNVKHLSFRQKIALHHSIDQSQFDEYKRKFGGQATFLLGDIPVTPQMNYDDFKKSSKNITDNFKFEDDLQLNSDVQQAYLSGNALAAYKTCVAAQAKDAVGLKIVPISYLPDDKVIRLMVKLNTNTDDKTERTLDYNISGGTIGDSDAKFLKSTQVGSFERLIVIMRDNVDEDAYFRVMIPTLAQDGEDDIVLRKRPRIWRRVAIRKPFHQQSWEARDNANVTDTYYPDVANGFLIDTTTVSVNPRPSGAVIEMPYKIEINTPEMAQAFAMYKKEAGRDAGCSFEWKGTEVRYEWQDVTDKPNELSFG